ncbi:MAG: hypothetical protein V4439_03545 [Patescibacteria group bacterium]
MKTNVLKFPWYHRFTIPAAPFFYWRYALILWLLPIVIGIAGGAYFSSSMIEFFKYSTCFLVATALLEYLIVLGFIAYLSLRDMLRSKYEK